jgi:hypothetical protein
MRRAGHYGGDGHPGLVSRPPDEISAEPRIVVETSTDSVDAALAAEEQLFARQRSDRFRNSQYISHQTVAAPNSAITRGIQTLIAALPPARKVMSDGFTSVFTAAGMRMAMIAVRTCAWP